MLLVILATVDDDKTTGGGAKPWTGDGVDASRRANADKISIERLDIMME